jgi:hypothetical protein
MDIACQYHAIGCETGIMRHTHGASFTCDTCGRDWAPAALVLDALDRFICERSLEDGPALADAIRIATGDSGPGDPDEQPGAGDLPAMLGVPLLPAAVVIAWACWRVEYDARLAEVA